MAAEAPHARGEATNSVAGALYPSKHIFRPNYAPPQQIACPSRQRRAIYSWRTKGAADGQAMPGDFVAVNRLLVKLDVRFEVAFCQFALTS